MGAKINNKFINQFVDIEVFSLDFGKTITCGEGGLILTNNDKIANIAENIMIMAMKIKLHPEGSIRYQ